MLPKYCCAFQGPKDLSVNSPHPLCTPYTKGANLIPHSSPGRKGFHMASVLLARTATFHLVLNLVGFHFPASP